MSTVRKVETDTNTWKAILKHLSEEWKGIRREDT